MKKLILCASLCLLFQTSVYAQQAATVISYQGLIQGKNGLSVKDSIYPISISIWTDASGGTELWQDVFQTSVRNGIFNIMIGSQLPLPASSDMDRPLWLAVNVGGSMDVVPRSRLSIVPEALNVADSSITAKKMATDYVSAIMIDGTKITSKGGALNLSSEGGVQFRFDSASNSVQANLPVAPVPNSSVYWSESGNNSTTPGTNYVGTSDSIALELHVNHNGDTTAGNGRVMRYEPMGQSPNIVGGYRGNYVTSSDSGGNVIAGGGNLAFPNWVAGNYATVSGGLNNIAYTGGTVSGGGSNGANEFGTVSGGTGNSANQGATVGGGIGNTANPFYATIGGGYGNSINASSIGPDHVAGLYSTISGGESNTIYGPGSAIPGGTQLNLGSYSFGFNGDKVYVTMLSDSIGIAYFGNVNMMIGNVDSVARQLRFYGPNTDPNYNPGAKYTAFRAPLMDSNVLYTLPKAQGDIGTILMNDGAGNLRWDDGSNIHGSWSITGNHGTHPTTNYLGTVDSNSLELHVFDSGSSVYGAKRVMRYEVNDTSANILGGFHDNAIVGTHIVGVTIAGGGANGHLNIAEGRYATISGGRENTDTTFAFVGGGDSNRATGSYSIVVGGSHNLNQGDSAVIVGGTNNKILSTPPLGTSIRGGKNCFVGAGSENVIGGLGVDSDVDPTFGSAIVAGDNNIVIESESMIGAGHHNSITDDYSFIGAGDNNTVNGGQDAIVAGESDTIGDHMARSAIVAGEYNTIDTSGGEAFIGAGEHNSSFGFRGFIGSGYQNIITSNGSSDGILSGEGLIAQSYSQTVLGFYNIPQGTSLNQYFNNPNDRILIVGSGKDTMIGALDTILRRNAFEVSNSGHSIVYHTNGTGGATPPPPGPPPPPPSGAIYGAHYQDNTCYAWGDAKGIFTSLPCHGTMQVNSDFGVDSVSYVCKGQYAVYLNTVDPYTGSRVNFAHGFSVTATSVVIAAGIPNTILQVTPLGAIGLPANAFMIYLGSVTAGVGAVDGEVMFHVFGRE